MESEMLKKKQCDDEEDWTKVSYNNARGKKRKWNSYRIGSSKKVEETTTIFFTEFSDHMSKGVISFI